MARSDITRNVAPGTNAAAGLAVTWLAGDPVNNHRIRATGKEMLWVRNTSGTTAYNVSIDSTPDPHGRQGDITNHSVPANGHAIFGPWDTLGWVDASGYINVDVQNAALQLAVIVLP